MDDVAVGVGRAVGCQDGDRGLDGEEAGEKMREPGLPMVALRSKELNGIYNSKSLFYLILTFSYKIFSHLDQAEDFRNAL